MFVLLLEPEARVTALSCKWLMGHCTLNSVDLPNGSSWMSGVGCLLACLLACLSVSSFPLPTSMPWPSNYLPVQVFVERCKYLEESKCVGICINTCKLPTQVPHSLPLLIAHLIMSYPSLNSSLPTSTLLILFITLDVMF